MTQTHNLLSCELSGTATIYHSTCHDVTELLPDHAYTYRYSSHGFTEWLPNCSNVYFGSAASETSLNVLTAKAASSSRSVLMSKRADWRCGNTPHLYLGHAGFNSRPRYQLPWVVFLWSSSVPPSEFLDNVSMHAMPTSFQSFPINPSFYYWTQYSPGTNNPVK